MQILENTLMVCPGTSKCIMSYIIGAGSLKAMRLENIPRDFDYCEDIRLRMDGLCFIKSN